MRILYIFTLLLAVPNLTHAGAIGLVRNITDELGIFVAVGIGIAMVLFMFGMIGFLAASGDQSAHDKGRQRMIWGIIALFFMVSIWGIVNIIQTLIGANVERGCTPTEIDVSRTGGGYIQECL
jgi:hypothetical protein